MVYKAANGFREQAMRDVLKRLGVRLAAPCAVSGALLALGLFAGAALAAENEVRLPVEKTARITPVGEVVDQDAAKKAAKGVPQSAEKGPALKAPKTALAKAAEAAAANAAPTATPAAAEAKPQAAKPGVAPKNAKPAGEASAAPAAAEPKPKSEPKPAAAKKSAKPAQDAASGASQSEAKPEGKAEAKPKADPKAKPAPPPPPAAKVDPLAAVLPPAPAAQPAAAPLPADGQWVGDLRLEYHADRVILRAVTNGPVERVTWFNLAQKDGPRKLAADLRGGWRKKGGSVLRCETGPVKVVVVGEHQDRLRLAVEFRDGAVKPDLEPKVELGQDGVILTIPLAVRLAP